MSGEREPIIGFINSTRYSNEPQQVRRNDSLRKRYLMANEAIKHGSFQKLSGRLNWIKFFYSLIMQIALTVCVIYSTGSISLAFSKGITLVNEANSLAESKGITTLDVFACNHLIRPWTIVGHIYFVVGIIMSGIFLSIKANYKKIQEENYTNRMSVSFLDVFILREKPFYWIFRLVEDLISLVLFILGVYVMIFDYKNGNAHSGFDQSEALALTGNTHSGFDQSEALALTGNTHSGFDQSEALALTGNRVFNENCQNYNSPINIYIYTFVFIYLFVFLIKTILLFAQVSVYAVIYICYRIFFKKNSLTDSEIDRFIQIIPTVLIEPAENQIQNQTESQLRCPVCLKSDTQCRYYQIRNCGHLYHYECIYPWITNDLTCPLCLINLSESEN